MFEVVQNGNPDLSFLKTVQVSETPGAQIPGGHNVHCLHKIREPVMPIQRRDPLSSSSCHQKLGSTCRTQRNLMVLITLLNR